VYSCLDMTSVDNAVVSRHDDTTVVKCITSSVTSILTCVDGRWTGQLINCTTVTLGLYLISPRRDCCGTIETRTGKHCRECKPFYQDR